MATYDYVQTDASATFDVGCSGQTAGATTAARQALDTGTPGVAEVTVDTGLNVTRAVFALDTIDPPNTGVDWASGNYVCPVNLTTMDAGVQFVRADLCDYNGSTYQAIVSNVVPTHTRGATGVVTVTFTRGTAYTPQSHSTSRLFIVLTFNNNDTHGASSFGITPNQTITTPIVIPAAATSGAGWSGAGVW